MAYKCPKCGKYSFTYDNKCPVCDNNTCYNDIGRIKENKDGFDSSRIQKDILICKRCKRRIKEKKNITVCVKCFSAYFFHYGEMYESYITGEEWGNGWNQQYISGLTSKSLTNRIKICLELIEMDPYHPIVLLEYANALEEKDDYSGSLDILEYLISKYPYMKRAYEIYARIKADIGEYKEALLFHIKAMLEEDEYEEDIHLGGMFLKLALYLTSVGQFRYADDILDLVANDFGMESYVTEFHEAYDGLRGVLNENIIKNELVELLIERKGKVTAKDINECEVKAEYNGKHVINKTEKGRIDVVAQDGSLDEKMNDLIGLDDVKKEIQLLLNFVKVQREREKNGLKSSPVSLHMVFTGNPGTGKTTVARIISKELQRIGVLSKGHLVEVDRSSIVAGYVGQTAILTSSKIEEAKGGVLFIDEAYTLAKGGATDFGHEAIDTLLKGMEDNRNDLIVIAAGYRNEMSEFINSNPGLKSRFTKYFDFPDYNATEMYQIFLSLCKKNDYVLTDDSITRIEEYFEFLEKNHDEHFGNGRDVRNFFELVITHQANRVSKIEHATVEDYSSIKAEDISLNM